jgi:ABC-type transporter Mla subunit MlaD
MQALGQALSLVQGFVQRHQSALQTDVDGLTTVAQTLVKQRDSLVAILQAAPLLTQNFAGAYDAKDNVLRGRADLNDLSVWSGPNTGDAPAGLLPGTGGR